MVITHCMTVSWASRPKNARSTLGLFETDRKIPHLGMPTAHAADHTAISMSTHANPRARIKNFYLM